MYSVSDEYKKAIYRPARMIAAKVIIDGVSYTGAELKAMTVVESVNAGDDLTVGSCCSASLDITILNQNGILDGQNLDGKTIRPYIGLQLAAGIEYVPLGVFETPSSAARENGYSLTIKAYDKMMAMEQPYDTSAISYPCTLMALLTDLCAQVGVELANTTIPNGDLVLQEGFFGMDMTCRAMLSYIAQVAGCYARFDRLGKLDLAWYTDSGIHITADNYMTVTVAEHTMPAITKLTIKTEAEDLGVSAGDGDVEYSIVGNPILYSNAETAIQGMYDMLSGMSYTPMEVIAQGNPALQAGDLITLTTLTGQTYQVPVMTHKIEYNGGTKSTLTAAGKSETDVTPKGTVTAKIVALQKQANVFERTLDETVSRIEKTETDVDTINSDVADLRQTAEGLSATVSNTVRGLDRVSGEVTDLDKRTTDLELSSNGFRLEVSKTYATKEEVDQIELTPGPQGEDAVTLRIESSRGTVFKNDSVSTVLSTVVYRGSERITDSAALRAAMGASAYIQWSWQRLDEDTFGTILSSDSRLSNDGFCFTLSPDDVDTKVTFMCELIAD